jgi:hypothetical protein
MNFKLFPLALLFVTLALPATATEPLFQELLEPYETIRLQLLHDHTEGVAQKGADLHRALKTLMVDFSAERAGVSIEDAEALQELLPTLIEAAGRLAKAQDLKSARDAFYDLSRPMVRYHAMVGEKTGTVAVYCPMARRSWLQPKEETIGNPYHGQSMAACGNVVGE